MHSTSVKKRSKRRTRSFVTTTYHEPKWLRRGRAFVKTTKRHAWNLLGGIGIITVALWLFQFIGMGR